MLKKNKIINYLLSFFPIILTNLTNSKKKSFFFFKKLFTALEIIFYIIKYYLEKTIYYNRLFLNNQLYFLEIKSFIFVIIFSFFFYYFIVIELSILIFGYSLLCYRFLFILIMGCLIAAWRLEATFLKKKMLKISTKAIPNWINYYKGEIPFTFYDYITDYKKKPLFRAFVVEKYWSEIDDGRDILITFFLFLIFFYFYSCAYRFDPRFVNFVAKYFHPVVNFFESRKDPRFEDLMSAIIWFRNWIFDYFDYSSETHDEVYEVLKNLTLASPWLEDRAHSQWNYKISLWKWVNFSDIYFLRVVSTQLPLRKMVFDLEQPIISATRFDPNWKLFFFRYIAQEFNNPKKSFWKIHFTNNVFFWDLIKDYKKDINRLSDSTVSMIKNNYLLTKDFSATTNEILLAKNYFNKEFFETQPKFQYYGTNWDYYHNIVLNNRIEKANYDDILKEFFTTTAYYNPPYTLSGLWSYQKKFKTELNLFQNNEFYKQGLKMANRQLNPLAMETKEDLFRFINFLNNPEFHLSFKLNVPLYNFYTMEHFESIPPRILEVLFSQPIHLGHLETLYYWYNYWLNALEYTLGLTETPFLRKFNEDFTIGYISNLVNWRIWRIKNILNNEGFSDFLSNEIVNIQDFKYFFRKYLKLSNFIPVIERKTLKDTYRGAEQKKKIEKKQKKIIARFSKAEIDDFINTEAELRSLETLAGLGKPTEWKAMENFNFIKPQSKFPWYILSLKYFATNDFKFVFPGFVRYYYPTPYPSAFSTFGSMWTKFQYVQRNKSSTIVGYTDSLAEMWSATPLALYSGIEAIYYLKPILDFFEFFIKLFIKFINYIIELVITQDLYWPLVSIFSLAVFVHIIWFIHFYIYTFVLFYLIYYFFVFYFRKIGFLWFYERLYQENFLMSYSSKDYWHPVSELWYNYRSPEQFLLLALQTNLLLHYSFFNYNNYSIVNNKTTSSITNVFFNLLSLENLYSNFVNFQKDFDININKFIFKNDCFFFQAFFIASTRKYQLLLFQGGSDMSLDHLIWNYFDYLNQISLFLSRGLWKNNYFNKFDKNFNSIIKQFTILISSQATNLNFLFLSTPILDSILSRKLIIKLFSLFKFKSKNFFFYKNDTIPFNYILFLNYKIEFYNFFLNSGLDIYNFFKNKDLNFLTKINANSFWDDIWYWILVFFWSFRFIPKTRFPFSNIDLSYEDSRLHLARLAYANSWISQSMIVWPHYNIIQHIWWTSWINSRAFGIVNSNINLNKSGIGILDDVRNFLEKRYSLKNSSKIETVFGFVTSLNLKSTYHHKFYGEIPFENKNFDLTYPNNLIDKKTTSRGYSKTNPPLNLYELGITPSLLLSFFKFLPTPYIKIYLTFLSQLDHIIKNSNSVPRNLKNEFSNFNFKNGNFSEKNHRIYAKYEFYFKKFDYLFYHSENKPTSNFIFTFDISYFLNHFVTWDYFSNDKSTLRSNFFKPSTFPLISETNNLFLSNLDLVANLNSYDLWLEKPFGVLDWFETFSLLKYKNIKVLDSGSFSRSRDDPFLNLDKEHTLSEIGLSVYPKNDKKNYLEAYSEEFSGFWNKRFPYNNSIISNQISLLIIGWVGELFLNTIESSSLVYSLLYASPDFSTDAWKTQNNLNTQNLILYGKKNKFLSFFAKNIYQKQLISWAFTWLNLMLSPSSYWYSFGPKANAWFDYWSWKCGITIDYRNGIYLYWPYLGFWHSFFTWLVPYDSLYGFYKSYRQINDNPLVIDPTTDAIDYFTRDDDVSFYEDMKAAAKSLSSEEKINRYSKDYIDQFSIPYWEIYFTFHHPYFVGYLFFWMLIFTSKNFYLGLSNFSFKRLILRDFLLKSTYNSKFNFNNLFYYRDSIENWFRKNMFKYWIYYSNPTALTNVLDCVLDEEILTSIDEINTMHRFYLMHNFLFKFLYNFRGYLNSDINFILDYWKIYNFNYFINWLTLDFPFTTNPYLVVNNYNFNINAEIILDIFKKQSFNFSHRTSLREAYNFNMFFDWSSGSYLDLFNLSSYLSSARAGMCLPDVFFNNPSFIAASFIWFKKDQSKNFAIGLQLTENNFVVSDILISNDLALHNLSLLNFFQESLSFIFSFNSTFYERKNFFSFVNFYLKSTLLNDLHAFNFLSVSHIDSKIIKYTNSNFFWTKELLFLYWLQKNLSYELVILLLQNGLNFSNWKQLNIFFKSFWFRIFTRYSQTHTFYKNLGLLISKFFFRKK